MKIIIIILIIVMGSIQLSFTQIQSKEIVYNFPKEVNRLIQGELNRDSIHYYDTTKFIRYITLYHETGTIYTIYVSFIERTENSGNRRAQAIIPLTMLTNRFLYLDSSLKIPIILSTDLVLSKYAISPNNHSYYIKFQLDGQIIEKGW